MQKIPFLRLKICNPVFTSTLDITNWENKCRRMEDEISLLKKQVGRSRDDSRRNREKLVLEFENTENRLNDSIQENDGKFKNNIFIMRIFRRDRINSKFTLQPIYLI